MTESKMARNMHNLENTDNALKLYNETHRDKMDLNEPQFSDFYKPSVQQKHGEMIYDRISSESFL